MRALALLLLAGCATAPVERDIVVTSNAPAAIGPYSQAVVVGDVLYAAGQIGLDPQSGELVDGGIRAQTQRALVNLAAVLAEAEFALEDVVQVTVYLVDLAEFTEMNDVYSLSFPSETPARATVQVAALPRGARVEIVAVADRRGR